MLRHAISVRALQRLFPRLRQGCGRVSRQRAKRHPRVRRDYAGSRRGNCDAAGDFGLSLYEDLKGGPACGQRCPRQRRAGPASSPREAAHRRLQSERQHAAADSDAGWRGQGACSAKAKLDVKAETNSGESESESAEEDGADFVAALEEAVGELGLSTEHVKKMPGDTARRPCSYRNFRFFGRSRSLRRRPPRALPN